MATSKKISARFQSNVGELNFIHAVKPDLKYGPTYQVTQNFSIEEGKQQVARMEALNPAFKGKIPFKQTDEGISFKIKQKRYISWFDKDGKKQERESIPTLLNKDNSPFTGTENPWGGTTGEVAMTVDLTKDQQGNPTVALRLVGIRFHDVKVGGAGGDSDPLFGGGKRDPDADPVEGDDPTDESTFANASDDDFDDDIPF